MIAGNDLRTMTDETKSILMNSDVVDIDQDPDAKPVQTKSTEGKSEVLVRSLSGNAVAVGLFNRGGQPAQISFRWDSLHLGANLGGHSLAARDLWAHSDVKIEGDTFNVTVPKHGVVLLKVSAGDFAFARSAACEVGRIMIRRRDFLTGSAAALMYGAGHKGLARALTPRPAGPVTYDER